MRSKASATNSPTVGGRYCSLLLLVAASLLASVADGVPERSSGVNGNLHRYRRLRAGAAGRGVASVVVRPEDDDGDGAAVPYSADAAKSDRIGRERRNSAGDAKSRARNIDIKNPDDIQKFAHVLHGLEELFKSTDIKKELGRTRSEDRADDGDDVESNDVDGSNGRLSSRTKYEPTWDSIDSRPLPGWYDEAKFGIFVHWGVYSVPSVGTEWFWWNWKGAESPSYQQFMSQNFKPNFTYAEFAPKFTAEFFNASEWATLFQTSGAKYVVFTSKHHEGFTNWPSPYSFNWNSVDVGPKRDLVAELSKAVKAQRGMKFGLYYSLFEWFNPLYVRDKENEFKTRDYAVNKMTPELKHLVETYKPEIVWSDGDWEPQYTYWDSPGFLAWLYNESPVRDTVVVNDRWGSEMACKHGGYYTCSDRFNPGTLQPHKWENCWTIDKRSWGYRRNAHIWEYCSIEELIQVLAETVACGGNLLLNVGPSHDGTIKPVFEERLLQMGAWLKVNGEAIYSSAPWIHQNDTVVPGVWYTKRVQSDETEKVYAIVLNWPSTGKLVLGAPKFCTNTIVNLLGWPEQLVWTASTQGPEIVFPPRQQISTDWGWVLVFQGLCNDP